MFTHRQRILAALDHRQPDRVPLDLGSTIVTGISIHAYNRLIQFLHLDSSDPTPFDRIAQLAVIDERILDLFSIDTRGVVPGHPINFQDIEDKDTKGFVDEWGIHRSLPSEADSYFVDNAPLSGEITINEIKTYPWPVADDPGRVQGLREKILSIKQKGDWAIILSLPANFISISTMLRGFEDWYIDSALNPQLIGVLMDQILEIQLEMCRLILLEVGDLVDIVINFDDLALQDRPMVSQATYRKILEPRIRQLYGTIKNCTKGKILHHTDGAIASLLPSLIEMGIDAVNPLQVSAKGMNDLEMLKNKFGQKITFWGGIDTQTLLPLGKPAEIQKEVQRTIDILNSNGGYVLTPVHNVLNDVPPENLVAIYEAVLGKSIKSRQD